MGLDELLTSLERRGFLAGQAGKENCPGEDVNLQAQRKNELELPADFYSMDKLPAGCLLAVRRRCPWLEIIPAVGPGCVLLHENGPWREEWRRLDYIKVCPQIAAREKSVRR
jgi:hypothetical protein